MSDYTRIVDEQDLYPAGWACEACWRDLEVGDEVIGRELSPDIFGEFRCAECVEAGRPIVDPPEGWGLAASIHGRQTFMIRTRRAA